MNTSSVPCVKAFYSPIEAAIRWSGLYNLEQSILTQLAGRLRPDQEDFPRWPKLYLNGERIYNALINADLPYGKNGVTCDDPSLLDDPGLTIREVDLKAWMTQHYPEERPSFLFSGAERHRLSRATINNMLNENAALTSKVNEYSKECERLKELNARLTQQANERMQQLDPEEALSDRGRSALLNIIGGLLTALRGQSPGGQRYSQFDSDADIIETVMTYHGGRVGISERTMQKHFAAARRSLNA